MLSPENNSTISEEMMKLLDNLKPDDCPDEIKNCLTRLGEILVNSKIRIEDDDETHLTIKPLWAEAYCFLNPNWQDPTVHKNFVQKGDPKKLCRLYIHNRTSTNPRNRRCGCDIAVGKDPDVYLSFLIKLCRIENVSGKTELVKGMRYGQSHFGHEILKLFEPLTKEGNRETGFFYDTRNIHVYFEKLPTLPCDCLKIKRAFADYSVDSDFRNKKLAFLSSELGDSLEHNLANPKKLYDRLRKSK